MSLLLPADDLTFYFDLGPSSFLVFSVIEASTSWWVDFEAQFIINIAGLLENFSLKKRKLCTQEEKLTDVLWTSDYWRERLRYSFVSYHFLDRSFVRLGLYFLSLDCRDSGRLVSYTATLDNTSDFSSLPLHVKLYISIRLVCS